MIEIANLAAALRDSNALDKGGMVQAMMAEDLACRTERPLLERTFAECRVRFSWLPRTHEILNVYAELEANAKAEAELQATRKMLLNRAQLIADAKAHPEDYVTVSEIMREIPAFSDHIAQVDQLKAKRDAPVIIREEKHLPDCPHCGMPVPGGVGDLRFLTAADLRSIADRRDREAAERKAAAERVVNAAAEPATAKKRRKAS